jgi:hypothetical protein
MELDPRSRISLMGSGETGPSMVKVHRTLIESLPEEPRPVAIHTTYGFQENAHELTAKAKAYFRESLGLTLRVASLRRAAGATALERARFRAALSEGNYLFAGPGSPSYALGNLRAVDAGRILRDQLARPVIVSFASAAAVTLGRFAIPVYEIYKVGQDPIWLEGLDLLSAFGIMAAVVPHWDNHEGATHDTSCCYIGARRLRILEEQLPEEAIVLGIDEHTCAVLGADGSYEVLGRGGLTIRSRGSERFAPSGSRGQLQDVIEVTPPAALADGASACPDDPMVRFRRLLNERELKDALGVLAEEIDHGRRDAALEMVARFADAADEGLAPREQTIAPFVELVLELRSEARASRNFQAADAIRDVLARQGVVVEDGPEGSSWHLEAR